MNKIIRAGLIFAVTAALNYPLTVPILAEEQSSPDRVTLEGGALGKVSFSHKGHIDDGITCKDCHHAGESPVQKCDSCHTPDSKVNSKEAYHKNCIVCHKAKAQGPAGCMECHKK
jgi:hypothetical protein